MLDAGFLVFGWKSRGGPRPADRSCELAFDLGHPARKIRVPFRQCPNAMHMVRQHPSRINAKRAFGARYPNRVPQHINMPQQRIRPTINQDRGEKHRCAGHVWATVAGLGCSLVMPWLKVRYPARAADGA